MTSVVDQPRYPEHEVPQRGSAFTGTRGMLRLYLRRDRIVLPLSTVQALAKRPGEVTSIGVTAQLGSRPSDVAKALEQKFGVTAIVYLVGVWRVRGGAALRAAVGWRTMLAGIGFFGAYALTLLALRLAPAASVAAVRESSVVIAAAVLAYLLVASTVVSMIDRATTPFRSRR